MSKSIEAVLQNSLTFTGLATNKIDRYSYNAYFVDLLRQLNEGLKKCNFVRSIREIWGTPPHEELNEEDMSARKISYKYKAMVQEKPPR